MNVKSFKKKQTDEVNEIPACISKQGKDPNGPNPETKQIQVK